MYPHFLFLKRDYNSRLCHTLGSKDTILVKTNKNSPISFLFYQTIRTFEQGYKQQEKQVLLKNAIQKKQTSLSSAYLRAHAAACAS